MNVNGYHNANGVGHFDPATAQPNGNTNNPTAVSLLPNGTSSKAVHDPSQSHDFAISMLRLPDEILEMLEAIPQENYVSIATLVRRATHACWTDLLHIIHHLAEQNEVRDLALVERYLPAPDSAIKNDVSYENRHRKESLWDWSMRCKHVLAKLLTLMQWASKREENRLTIALNFYIHKLRQAYSDANQRLVDWIKWAETRQDAAPDFHTAAQILAKGKLDSLPDLGYAKPKLLSDSQSLALLRRLDLVLEIRMATESATQMPPYLRDWHIHDGRVTFHIPNEFDLDLSVMSEDIDADFLVVDLKFNFSPCPSVSQELLDQVTTIVNDELALKGLSGAYAFLHELVLTQKLKEFHSQALRLRQSLWAGHLQVEMLKRTLIIQYWARRPSSKSWVELYLHSGRHTQDNAPFIHLKWMRHGKLVTQHDIELDLGNLSLENILNQIVAQHATHILDGIYDKLASLEIFSNGDLSIEQQVSLIDAFDCSLSIDITQRDTVQVSCDPIAGTLILSPASDRSSRLQYELSRSKDLIDDFVKRFAAFRCGLAQTELSKAVQNTSWISLAGRKPGLEEVKTLFGPFSLRAVFFKQLDWTIDWSLAAVFGSRGDTWYLVKESKPDESVAVELKSQPLHLEIALSSEYFSRLAGAVTVKIALQTLEQGSRGRGVKSAIIPKSKSRVAHMRMELDGGLQLTSMKRDVVIAPCSADMITSKAAIVVVAELNATVQLLQKLSDAGLDKSIAINAKKRTARIDVPCLVGEQKFDEILGKLRYVDDLVSCINLVHNSPVLKMRSLTLNSIIIGYQPEARTNLSIEFFFDATPGQPRIRLLPTEGNPHGLVAKYLEPFLEDISTPLSGRLHRLLSNLSMTLPLVNGLQYLQGKATVDDVPEMKAIDTNETRKWIRVHVMARDPIRFGVHIFAVNSNFKKDPSNLETRPDMLLRLEILPHPQINAGKLSWLIRPAIEEFRTYHRPSYASQSLKQLIQRNVFASDEGKPWIGLDSAAKCLTDNPYGLLIALHDTIVEWLKGATSEKSGVNPKSAHAMADVSSSAQPAKQPTMNGRQAQQRPQIQNQQQNRPQNMQSPIANGNAANTGNSRVMMPGSAHVRPQVNNNRQRPNQNPNRAMHQNRAMPGPQDHVINLD